METQTVTKPALEEVLLKNNLDKAAVASVGGFYQRVIELNLQLWEKAYLERKTASQTLKILLKAATIDGNTVLDKKTDKKIAVIRDELVLTLGSRSRWKSETLQGFIQKVLESAPTLDAEEKRLYSVFAYLARKGLAAYQVDGFVAQTTLRHLGRIGKEDLDDVETEYALMEIANELYSQLDRASLLKPHQVAPQISTAFEGDWNLFEDTVEEEEEEYATEEGKGKKVYADWAVFPIVEGTSSQSPEQKVVIHRAAVESAIAAKRAEAHLLQVYRVALGKEFGFLRKFLVPVSTKVLTKYIIEEIAAADPVSNKPMIKTAFEWMDSLKAKGWYVDRRSFGSPNRPGSKWFLSQKVLPYGTEVDDQISDAALWLNPAEGIGNRSRYSGFSAIRSSLLPDGDARYKQSYLQYVAFEKTFTEAPGNLATFAFLEKTIYHPVMKLACIREDANIRVSDRVPDFGKIDLGQKSKGMIYDAYDGKSVSVKLPNGDVHIVDYIMNSQGKRMNQPTVLGMSAARLAKYAGQDVPVLPSGEPEKLTSLLKSFTEQFTGSLCVDGQDTGIQAVVGIGKFFYDQSQNFLPKVRTLSMGYTQAIQCLTSNEIIENGKMTLSEYLSMSLPAQFQSQVVAAQYNLESLKGFEIPESISPLVVLANVSEEEIEKYKTIKPRKGSWIQDDLLQAGVLGDDVALIHNAYYALGEPGLLDVRGRVELLHNVCTNGFAVKIPWQTEPLSLLLHAPVSLSDDGLVFTTQVFNQLLLFLRKLAGYAYYDIFHRDERTCQKTQRCLEKSLDQFRKKIEVSFGEGILHRRGWAVTGRNVTGNASITHEIIPLETFLEFIGYEQTITKAYIRKEPRDVGDEFGIRERRKQVGTSLVEKIDRIVEASSKDKKTIEKAINSLFEKENVMVTVFKHPILGELPKVPVRVKTNLKVVITPQSCVGKETTSLDDDSDVAYVVFSQSSVK